MAKSVNMLSQKLTVALFEVVNELGQGRPRWRRLGVVQLGRFSIPTGFYFPLWRDPLAWTFVVLGTLWCVKVFLFKLR